MNDNEIIKALHHCLFGEGCCDCPIYTQESCRLHLVRSIEDLINRQKEEIERLKPFEKKVIASVLENLEQLEYVKYEAYKEFAERLKNGVLQETGVIRCKDVDFTLTELTEKRKMRGNENNK